MTESNPIAASGLIRKLPSGHPNAEIRTGSLQPVERIWQGNWAAEPGVALPLIREPGQSVASSKICNQATGSQTSRHDLGRGSEWSSRSFHLPAQRVDTQRKNRDPKSPRPGSFHQYPDIPVLPDDPRST
jgi:hypothetical protein